MSRGPVRQIKALSSEDDWGTTSCQVPTWETGEGGGGGTLSGTKVGVGGGVWGGEGVYSDPGPLTP